MKTIASGLAAHYALETTTVAHCIKITRLDATVVAATSCDLPLVIGGVTYLPQGLDVSSLSSSSGLNVDNLELTILPDDTGPLSRSELLTGKWSGAAFELFEVNYLDLAGGINTLKRGRVGDIKLDRSKIVVELRSLTQALQQPIGEVTSRTCRNRLGDARCQVNLAPFTATGTVTSVASNQVFTASAMAQAAEYFEEGTLTFTSGPNAGYEQKVKLFASGGVFTLSLAMPFTVGVGNTFSAVAGCKRRHITDCKTKFSNLLNFRGEPHLPGMDALTAAPEAAV